LYKSQFKINSNQNKKKNEKTNVLQINKKPFLLQQKWRSLKKLYIS